MSPPKTLDPSTQGNSSSGLATLIFVVSDKRRFAYLSRLDSNAVSVLGSQEG